MATRRGLIDALLGAALAVTLLGTAAALSGSWGGVSWLLDLVTGAVVGGLALRRHARPAAFAIAGSAVAAVAVVVAWLTHRPHEPGPATVLALAVLVASAIRQDGPRAAALEKGGSGAAAVGKGGSGAAALGKGGSGAAGVGKGGWRAAGCGLVVVVVAGLCSRPYGKGVDVITVVAALGWLTAVAAGLGLRLRDAQRAAVLDGVRRDERLDVARELHDLAAHHLTGLVLQTQAARIVARKDASRVDGELAGIETAGSEALDAIRRVVGLLRDPSDAAPTGPPSLGDLISDFASRPGAPAVRADIDEAALPPSAGSTVYRIVQEGLTNVVRHAPQARTVDIAVRVDDGELTVAVADDGPPQTYQGGYGLIGMAERVHALGGRMEAGPRPGGGWQIKAHVRVVP